MKWSMASLIGGLALLVGCTSAQPVVPTAAPAPTMSAASATTVSGTVDAIDGRVLTVNTNTGAKHVQVAEDARIEQEGKGTLADLLPGLGVGVTGKPEGSGVTAESIRIFPAALGTPRPGQFPMNGANQGNLMTNSVIESFDGSKLVLNAGGQRYEIAVPAGTEVLKPVPAAFSALAPGTRVLATGTPGADGTLRAVTVNLMGSPPR
jgi:hypothetical protein